MITLYLTPRQELISLFSDTHKDAYGFRPRMKNWDAYTDQELSDAIDQHCATAQKEAAAEKQWEEERVIEFKAMVQRYINEFGAADEREAIKWWVDSLDMKFYNGQCVEQLIWKEGLMYTTYGAYLLPIVNEFVTYED